MTSSYLWKEDRHGNQVKKSLLTDLEEVLQYCSFDVGGPAFVFWNSVEEGSDEHLVLGMAVGSKLYNSHEQCIERVGAAFHNFFCGRTLPTRLVGPTSASQVADGSSACFLGDP